MIFTDSLSERTGITGEELHLKTHTSGLLRVLDSIAVSVFVVILVEFDKSETSRLV